MVARGPSRTPQGPVARFKGNASKRKFIMSERSKHTVRRTIAAGALLAVFVFPVVVATAQSGQSGDSSEASLTLPNAPGFGIGIGSESSSSSTNVAPAEARGLSAFAAASGSLAGAAVESMPEASPTEKFIRPGQIAPTLTGSDKVLLGVKNAFMPFEAFGWFVAAGYSQVTNSSPNFGTDRGAFGMRLGAAAIRGSSENIFGDSVMSNLFHEDPRYYQMGPAHNFFVRLVYSGTRPLFTRMDSGRATPNFAKLTGTMGGAMLTNLYYPQANRSVGQTMQTFGGSVGASALSGIVSEFYGDVLHLFHLRHN